MLSFLPLDLGHTEDTLHPSPLKIPLVYVPSEAAALLLGQTSRQLQGPEIKEIKIYHYFMILPFPKMIYSIHAIHNSQDASMHSLLYYIKSLPRSLYGVHLSQWPQGP